MSQWRFRVEGIKCAGCVAKIEKTLEELPSVSEVKVDLVTKEVFVKGEKGLSKELLQKKLKEIGYESELREEKKEETFQEKYLFLGALLFTLVTWGIAMGTPSFWGKGWILAFLSGVVVFGFGFSFFYHTFLRAPKGIFDMDTLIAMGSGASYFYSLYLLLKGVPYSYFDGAAMIVMFVLLGRFLEKRALLKSRSSMRSLLESRPKRARVLKNGTKQEVSVDLVKKGDRVLVRPGEVVPVDGKILEGEGYVNESMFTGEPVPVWRKRGDELKGGCLSVDGAFILEVVRPIQQSYISQIIALVEEAQRSKAPIQRIADRVAGVFVPFVLFLAGVTFGVHWLLGKGWEASLLPAVAVLLIACPCTLGLATPVAITVALGRAAKLGFVFRTAEALETLRQVDLVCLDKTGTVTEGKPEVVEVYPKEREELLLQLAASLEEKSEHPLGRAIVSYWKKQGGEFLPVSQFRYVAGKGVMGTIQGKKLLLGRRSWLEEEGVKVEVPEEKGYTLLYLAEERKCLGWIGLSDKVREGAREALERIQKMGIQPVLLTGDRKEVAELIGKALGISQIKAELLPHEKLEVLRQWKQSHVVAMVGDGVNDAPALSEAHVGIAMASGTDVAVETAPVIFFSPRFQTLADIFSLARATSRIILSNLFFAFFYNVAAIPIAALGMLSPTVAALAMSLSSVSVVTNSNRLRWVKL